MANTLLSIDGKRVFLSDVAYVEKKHEKSATIASFNGNLSVTLAIDQTTTGDALIIVNDINKLLIELKEQYPQLIFTLHDDRSDRIRDRLNIVISNILLAILLVGGSIWLLVNGRVSLVVTIGIPKIGRASSRERVC